MRIPKGQSRKEGEDTTSRSATEESQFIDDPETPAAFDPDEFDLDFMMGYPYYSTDVYGFPQMQSQYPSFPFDQSLGEAMYRNLGDENPLLASSPESDQGQDEADEEIVPQKKEVSEELFPKEAMAVEQTGRPAKKYSVNVKVKPPETAISLLSGANESKVDQKPIELQKALDLTGMQQNSVNYKGKPDPTLLMHNYVSPAPAIDNLPSATMSAVSAVPYTTTSVASKTITKHTPTVQMPSGTVILKDGRIMVLSSNQSGSQLRPVIAQTLPATSSVSSSMSSSLGAPAGPDDSSLNLSSSMDIAQEAKSPQVRQPRKLPVKKRLTTTPYTTTEGHSVVVDTGQLSNAVILKKMKREVEPSDSMSELGPATPTSSLAQMLPLDSESTLESKLAAWEVGSVASIGEGNDTISDKDLLVEEAGPSTRKRSKSRTSKSTGESSTPAKKKQVTPVSTITDIVGLKAAEESPDLLKEATSRPIRHRVEVASAESAKERSVKNAINARMNRQKHKQYVQTLEEENSSLKEAAKDLRRRNGILHEEKDILNQEIVYLKKVIANDSALAKVLSGLNGLKDVRLTSNFAKRHQNVGQRQEVVQDDASIDVDLVSKIQPQEVDQQTTATSMGEGSQVQGSVCLTVSGDMASIELCDKCDHMASASV